MILATDYPFLDIVGTMLVFFFWVMWFWCLILVLSDVFRRKDLSGWAKAGWATLMVFIPWLGVLVYLIAHGKDMGERRLDDMADQQARFDAHIRQVATSDSTAEIARAKELLDSGAIDASEYDILKRKALAA